MRVGLLTPCYNEHVHNDYMLSVIATDRMAAKLGIDLRVYVATGTAILPRVRNRLVAQAMAEECDWLVCIDDDIGFNAPDLFKLINHGVDVVAAAPAKRHHRWDEQPAAVAKFPHGTITGRHTPAGRLWKMDAVATGFMAIRSSVITKLEPVTREYITEGTTVRDWFWLELIASDGHATDEGEDYNFCRKWIGLGGECWVDPDIRVRHYTGSVCHDVCLADAETSKEEAA
jgi:glycosyltransferase involved in cell wall biosynthesis